MGARRRLKVAQALACVLGSCLSAQVPNYVTGDECLFCHRVKVAATWEKNPHARTVHPRDASDPVPADAPFVLGAHPPQRGLRPDGYGKFDLLSADGKAWDKQAFALRCAGCHTTAVDPQTHAFSASSLDCYTCHGVAPPNHPNDTSLIWFSKKHSTDPKQIVSICGQCHLRRQVRSERTSLPQQLRGGRRSFRRLPGGFRKTRGPYLPQRARRSDQRRRCHLHQLSQDSRRHIRQTPLRFDRADLSRLPLPRWPEEGSEEGHGA